MVNICDMVIAKFVDLEKIDGQTNKQKDKPTETKDYSHHATIINQRRQKAFISRATIINKHTDKPTETITL